MLTADILIALANYYETSIDYLLYETDEKRTYKKSIMKQSVINKMFSIEEQNKIKKDIDKLINS